MGLFDNNPDMQPQGMLGGGNFDPRTQGLLAAAFRGMAASGPSRMPVSLGQVIGEAGGAGMQQYSAAQKEQMAMALQKMQLDKLQAENAIMQSITSGGLTGKMNADQLDKLGLLTGHAGVIGMADRMRKEEAANAEMQLLKSQPAPITAQPTMGVQAGAPAMRAQVPPQTSDAEMIAQAKAAAAASPTGLASIGSGPSANPAENTQRVGGLFANEIANPTTQAQGLLAQNQVDQANGRIVNPQHFRDMQARMAAAETQRQQQVAMAKLVEASRPPHVYPIVQTDTGVFERRPEGLVPLTDPKTGGPLAPKGSNPLGLTTGTADQPNGGVSTDLTGEELLKTLPPNIASEVKARAAGDKMPPSSFALKSPFFQQMMGLVQQYDPTYTDRRYSVKQETLGKGQTKNTLTNLNQAVMHAGTLYELDDAMKNSNFPLVNQLMNVAKTQTGQSAVTSTAMAQQVLGTELMRTFRGAGAGSEKEAAAFDERLKATIGSPEQQQEVLKTVANLLNGRLKVMGDQYVAGMGGEQFRTDLLTPSAKSAWSKIGGVATSGYVETRKTADGKTLGKKADGTIEEIK